MAQPFFTVGHSTRPLQEFAGLLREAEVQLVVDVRTVPRSRTNPQYNSDVLPVALSEFQIAYQHMPALGGLRGRSRAVPREVNAFWGNQSFHNYADYALTPAFHSGLARLRELGQEQRCAIMCAEALWWRCHRRIIADHLINQHETVFHIFGPDHVEPARLTRAARPGPEGTLTYPAEV
ncbi:MAG: hypothetical protein QOK29_4199 [Rhodospirillaceae bacterium]|jgi:uncharacterized protein (DUF488 family)|nr:hypothetical protein [Rhodospirillaceae bacterium]